MSNVRFAVGDKVWDTARQVAGVVTEADGFDSVNPYRILWANEEDSYWSLHVEDDLEPYTGQDNPEQAAGDAVHHPAHYVSDPSGVECIQITRHRNFDIGSAFKYLWRAGLKQDAAMDSKEKQIEDLKKAIWYINDEISRLEQS